MKTFTYIAITFFIPFFLFVIVCGAFVCDYFLGGKMALTNFVLERPLIMFIMAVLSGVSFVGGFIMMWYVQTLIRYSENFTRFDTWDEMEAHYYKLYTEMKRKRDLYIKKLEELK